MSKDKAPSWVEQAKQEAADQANQENVNKAYENSRTSAYKKGGKVSSASKRADGIASRGKTRGRIV